MKKYAGFTERLGALIIDGILILAVTSFARMGGNYLFVTLVALAYNVWMVGMYGATIGKRVMRLRVTRENGGKLSYSDALVRELSKYLSGLVFFIGFVAMIWDKRHQTWHDKIARAVVVKV